MDVLRGRRPGTGVDAADQQSGSATDLLTGLTVPDDDALSVGR